ncbi:hypothetical protein KC332_g39 [Hortaea werneckii]|nr:hypothetical protein KC332_g39 [Hortaea werneckii]
MAGRAAVWQRTTQVVTNFTPAARLATPTPSPTHAQIDAEQTLGLGAHKITLQGPTPVFLATSFMRNPAANNINPVAPPFQHQSEWPSGELCSLSQPPQKLFLPPDGDCNLENLLPQRLGQVRSKSHPLASLHSKCPRSQRLALYQRGLQGQPSEKPEKHRDILPKRPLGPVLPAITAFAPLFVI